MPSAFGQRAVADAGFQRIELGNVDAGDQCVEDVLAFRDQAKRAFDRVFLCRHS